MAMATPVLASIPSSPEEKEATRQLNLQQLAMAQQDGQQTMTDETSSGFTAATDATGEEAATGETADLTDDNNADTGERTAMADETSPAEGYVTDQNPAEDVKPDVNPDITQQGGPAGESNVDAPSDQEQAANDLEQDYAANMPDTASTDDGVALTTVANPASTLEGLSIKSTSGEALGTVDDVVLGADGKPTALEVAVEGGSTVTVAASNFVFDQDSKMVITHLSRAQIDAQPPA
jgi:sporulation protein YlmC with PRC-barrel domain